MSSRYALEFEKPLIEVELKIEELKLASATDSSGHGDEIRKLEEKSRRLISEIYSNLTPWQITQVARHPDRPYAMDYIKEVFDEFTELHGDRCFGDDHSIVGGLARLDRTPVVVIGQQKGRSTKEKILRNFGMTNPEGYRKALRLMRLAERFSRPVITLIDTPGAYPGVGAEERGQAEAIATNLLEMSALKTPVVSVVIGEGGSGGALALGVADKVMMMEFSTYSVISPEGCAAILWKDGSMADVAASALRITSTDLMELKLIDKVIREPLGAAHRNQPEAAKNLKDALVTAIKDLSAKPIPALVEERYRKFRAMGAFTDKT